jgi:hypothetical protein
VLYRTYHYHHQLTHSSLKQYLSARSTRCFLNANHSFVTFLTTVPHQKAAIHADQDAASSTGRSTTTICQGPHRRVQTTPRVQGAPNEDAETDKSNERAAVSYLQPRSILLQGANKMLTVAKQDDLEITRRNPTGQHPQNDTNDATSTCPIARICDGYPNNDKAQVHLAYPNTPNQFMIDAPDIMYRTALIAPLVNCRDTTTGSRALNAARPEPRISDRR